MINVDILRTVIAPFALALLGFSTLISAAEPGGSEARRFSDENRATSETKPGAKSAFKVLPFVEDEEQRPAQKLTAPKQLGPNSSKPLPRKSNFQPRFKTPAVQQAQHTEPVENESGPKLEGVDSAGQEAGAPASGLKPVPMADNPGDKSGRPLIDEAFAKSKVAQSLEDYTAVIDLCRRGIDAGLRKTYVDYAHRLMGWAHNRSGEAQAQAGNEEKALADFEASVKFNPESWRAVHNRAVSYAAQGKIKEAMVDFDRTIELNQNYANAYFNRGELSYLQGEFPKALRDYTEALRLAPPESSTLNSRGHAFYRLHQFNDALRDYGEAIKLDPENAAALINRGDTFLELGKYGEAAKDYRAAVKVSPKLGRAYQSAAWLMATSPDEHYRNDKLAIEAAKKAIELDGEDDFRYLETLAAAQANVGMFKEARETQEKAIAKAPQQDMATCERRMALYRRELAYRELPNAGTSPGIDNREHPVRQASGTQPLPPSRSNPPRNARSRNAPGR